MTSLTSSVPLVKPKRIKICGEGSVRIFARSLGSISHRLHPSKIKTNTKPFVNENRTNSYDNDAGITTTPSGCIKDMKSEGIGTTSTSQNNKLIEVTEDKPIEVKGDNSDMDKFTQSSKSDEIKHTEDRDCDKDIGNSNLITFQGGNEGQSSAEAKYNNSTCIKSQDCDVGGTRKEVCISMENDDQHTHEIHQNDSASLTLSDHESSRMSVDPNNEMSKTNQGHGESSTSQDHSEARTNQDQSESRTNQDNNESKISQVHSESRTDQGQSESKTSQNHSEARTNQDHSESSTNQDQRESRTNQDNNESKTSQNHSEARTNQNHSESRTNQDLSESRATQDHNESRTKQDYSELRTNQDQDHSESGIIQSDSESRTNGDQHTGTNDECNTSRTNQDDGKSEKHNDFNSSRNNQNQNARIKSKNSENSNLTRTSRSYNTSRINQDNRDSNISGGGNRNMNANHHTESRKSSQQDGRHHQTYGKSRQVSQSCRNRSHDHQAPEQARSYRRDSIPSRFSHDNKLSNDRALHNNRSQDNRWSHDNRSSHDNRWAHHIRSSHDNRWSHDNRDLPHSSQRHDLSNRQFERKGLDKFKTCSISENKFSHKNDAPKQKFSNNFIPRFSQGFQHCYNRIGMDCTTFKKSSLQSDQEENWMNDLMDVSEIIDHHGDSVEVDRDSNRKLYSITEELFENGKVLEPSISDKIAISGVEDWSCDFDEIVASVPIKSGHIEQEISNNKSEMLDILYDKKSGSFDVRCLDICHDQEVPSNDLVESKREEVNFPEVSGIKTLLDEEDLRQEEATDRNVVIDVMETGVDVYRTQGGVKQEYNRGGDKDVICDEIVTDSTADDNREKLPIDAVSDGEKCSDENKDVYHSDRENKQAVTSEKLDGLDTNTECAQSQNVLECTEDHSDGNYINRSKKQQHDANKMDVLDSGPQCDVLVDEMGPDSELDNFERDRGNVDQDFNMDYNLKINSVEDNKDQQTHQGKTDVAPLLKGSFTGNEGIEKSLSEGNVVGENIDEAHDKDVYIVSDTLISNDELNELCCSKGQVCASKHLEDDTRQGQHGDKAEIFTELEEHGCNSFDRRNISESENEEKCLIEKLFMSEESDNCTIDTPETDMLSNVSKKKHKTKKKKKSKVKKKIPPCQTLSHLHVSVSEEPEVVDIGGTDYEKLVKNKLKALEKERSTKTVTDIRINAQKKRKNKEIDNKKSDKSGTAASLFIDLMSALRKRSGSKLGTEFEISEQEVNDLLNLQPTHQSSPKPFKDDKQWLQMAENWEHELMLLNHTPDQDMLEKKESNISMVSSENNDTLNTTESENFFSCEESKDVEETTGRTSEYKTVYDAYVGEGEQYVSLVGCCRPVGNNSETKKITCEEEEGYRNSTFSNSWEEQLKSLCVQRGTVGGGGFRKFRSGVAKSARGKHAVSLNDDKSDNDNSVRNHAPAPVSSLIRENAGKTLPEGKQASCYNSKQDVNQNLCSNLEGGLTSLKSDYSSRKLQKKSQLTTGNTENNNHSLTDTSEYFTCGLPAVQENWENSLIDVEQYITVKDTDNHGNGHSHGNMAESCGPEIYHSHVGEKLDIEVANPELNLLRTGEIASVNTELSTESDNNRDAYYPLSENTLSEVLTISDFETSAAGDDIDLPIDGNSENDKNKVSETLDSSVIGEDKMSMGNPVSDPFDPWPGYLYGFKNNPVLSESLVVNPPHSNEKVSGINPVGHHKTVNRMKNLFNNREESVSQTEQLVIEDGVYETSIPMDAENRSEPPVNGVSDQAGDTEDNSQCQYSGCVCPPYDVFFWIWRTCGCHIGHRPTLCDIRAATNWYNPPYVSPHIYYSSNIRETSQDATNYKMRPGMDGAEVQDDACNTDLNMNNGNVYSNDQVKDENLNNTDYTSPPHKQQASENMGRQFRVPPWMFTSPPPPPPPHVPHLPNRALWARMNYWSRCPPPLMSLHSPGPRSLPRARWSSMMDGPPVVSPMHAHFMTCNPRIREECHGTPETKLCSSTEWSHPNIPPSKCSDQHMTSPDDKGQGYLSRKTQLEDMQTDTVTTSKQQESITPQKIPGHAKNVKENNSDQKMSNFTLMQKQQKMFSDQKLFQKCPEVQNFNVSSPLGRFNNPYSFTYGTPPFPAHFSKMSGSCTRIQNNLADEEESASDEDVDLSSYDVSLSPREHDQIKMNVDEKNMMGRGRFITSRLNELQNKMEKNRIKHKRVAKLRHSPQQLVDYESSETEDSDEGKKFCRSPTDGKILTDTSEINDENNNNVMDKRRKLDSSNVFHRRSTGRMEDWWNYTPSNENNNNVSKERRLSDSQMYHKNKFLQELQNDNNKVGPYVPPYRRKQVVKLDSESSDFDGEDSSDVSFSIASQEDSNVESSNVMKKKSQTSTSNTSANSSLPFWASFSSSRESSPLCGYQPYSKPNISTSPLDWRNPRAEKNKNCSTDSDGTSSISQTSINQIDWKQRFKDRCRRYGVNYVDSHCHVDFLLNRQGYSGSWSQYLQDNKDTVPDNYEGCVAVFCAPNSFRPEGGMWKEVAKEDNVWLAMGCHPKSATEFSPKSEEGLRRCLQHEKFVALGEIGLDYSGTFKQHEEIQKAVFSKQIKIALDYNKPLVIHCRDAEDECLEILEKMVPKNYKIHCHCFMGNFESAQKWLNLFPNLYIGLTPVVTYRTAVPTHNVARFIPLERLLLETDAPYFIPRSFPKHEVKYSHPGMAVVVAEAVARLRNCTVAEVLRHCRQNTRNMYGV